MPTEVKSKWEELDFKSLSEYIATESTDLEKYLDTHLKSGRIDDTNDPNGEKLRERDEDLGRAHKRWEGMRETQGILEKAQKRRAEIEGTVVNAIPQPSGSDGSALDKFQGKSLGQLFTESKSYTDNVKGEGSVSSTTRFQAEIEGVSLKSFTGMKAPMTNAAGYPPPISPDIRVVPYANRRPVVADLIPQFNTTFPSIPYLEETTFTNNAAGVLELGSKPNSALGLTRRNATVEVIAHYIVVSTQQLEDVPQVRSLIDDRLTFMLELAEESGLLNGTGTSPDLVGFYNKSGTNAQALGADNAPNAIMKGFNKIRIVGYAEPTGVIFHNTDWMNIRTLQTTIGSYIWGDPSTAGPERIWGVPVVQTPAATLGAPLAGDFQLYSQIARRMMMTVQVGFVNDDFIKNQQTIRAEERLSLLIYRAAAFTVYSGF
jgi:HK97 family phage major capsid protein